MDEKKTLFLYWTGWIMFGMGIIQLFAPFWIKLPASIVIPGFLIDLLGFGEGAFDFSLLLLRPGLRLIPPLLMFIVGPVLIYLSNRTRDKRPKHCSVCNKIYDGEKSFCPQCGVKLVETKYKYATLFKYIVVLIVIIKSFLISLDFERMRLPGGNIVIPHPGNVFRLQYSLTMGVIVFIIIIVIPNLFTYLSKK